MDRKAAVKGWIKTSKQRGKDVMRPKKRKIEQDTTGRKKKHVMRPEEWKKNKMSRKEKRDFKGGKGYTIREKVRLKKGCEERERKSDV